MSPMWYSPVGRRRYEKRITRLRKEQHRPNINIPTVSTGYLWGKIENVLVTKKKVVIELYKFICRVQKTMNATQSSKTTKKRFKIQVSCWNYKKPIFWPKHWKKDSLLCNSSTTSGAIRTIFLRRVAIYFIRIKVFDLTRKRKLPCWVGTTRGSVVGRTFQELRLRKIKAFTIVKNQHTLLGALNASDKS